MVVISEATATSRRGDLDVLVAELHGPLKTKHHCMGIYEFPEEGYDLPEGKLETELEYTLYVGAMAARVA